jgi:outer membrane protein assembly factor BamD
MRQALYIIIFLAFSSFIFSCAHEAEKIKPAQELFDEASQLAKKGKVDKAAEEFMQVRTYYPGHELARKSILSTADLYYDQADYELALKNYEEFRLLYPTDTDAGYCLFRIGMCHYKQMGTLDRDQSETMKAIQTFEGFMKTYPTSPQEKDAESSLKEARTLLAKHYLYIGKFYMKKGNSKAACTRFQSIKKHYSDVDLGEDIDTLISTSCTASVTSPVPATK